MCSFLGALQVPALLVALSYLFACLIYNWKGTNVSEDSLTETKNQSILEKCAQFWDSPVVKSTPNRQPLISGVQPSAAQLISSPTAIPSNDVDPTTLIKNKMGLNLKEIAQPQQQHTNDDDSATKSQSAIYFKVLFLSCLVTILYKQSILVLGFCFIPISIYIAKKAIVLFGIKEYLQNILIEFGTLTQVNKTNQLPLFKKDYSYYIFIQ